MNARRAISAWAQDYEEGHDKLRGPNGRRLCRWCREEVKGSRNTFCGKQECVYEWNVRANPSYARREVWKRDKGVCALCGRDTEALAGKAQDIIRRVSKATFQEKYQAGVEVMDLFREAGYAISEYRVRYLVLGTGSYSLPHLWEMDHIIPVAEGGGGTGLENLRTLCKPCHSKETGKLRKRLNEERKRKQQEWARQSVLRAWSRGWDAEAKEGKREKR